MSATPAVALRSVQFRREREATWQELELLVEKASTSGLRSLTAEQLARLPHLYRATLSSLSVARAISLDRALTAYLESLVGRAYFCVYGTRHHLLTQLRDFFAWRLPAAVRRAKWHLALAVGFLLLGAVVAYVMTTANPDNYYTFMGDMAQGRTPASSTTELRNQLYDQDNVNHTLGFFASFLFDHNATISILSFALGFIAGIPTFYFLISNGLNLGAFVALYSSRGLTVDVGSSRVDLQACKLEYSIVSPK